MFEANMSVVASDEYSGSFVHNIFHLPFSGVNRSRRVLEVVSGCKGISDIDQLSATLYQNNCRVFFPQDLDAAADTLLAGRHEMQARDLGNFRVYGGSTETLHLYSMIHRFFSYIVCFKHLPTSINPDAGELQGNDKAQSSRE
ncbi:hypothetical protein F3Y22_tig00110599pilonHSYRG00018 [Hibiscus syriacus]|uniref:Uncharacterized protein n=1 Tax=Hibiscus syriacus TaxID=106335 RepID=A0A6A3A1Y4_HIBSY|nr:hypothetical protein F3Y22_tig00110599pilonHSYRG00018 [Hibiscus syriacus]